jgi:phosphomethylpyrimidine synthase
MNANPKFLNAAAEIDAAAVLPLPNSRKIHVDGTQDGVRVPMREITQADTAAMFGNEKNPPIFVYDTSGPYTDPECKIDIRKGLSALRGRWIDERADTAPLDGPSSAYGRARLEDAELAQMRFELGRKPLRAREGCNVSQMHYARRGIVTPEMEFIAIRENSQRERYLESLTKEQRALISRQHRGEGFGAAVPALITPEFVRDEVAQSSRPTSIIRKRSR